MKPTNHIIRTLTLAALLYFARFDACSQELFQWSGTSILTTGQVTYFTGRASIPQCTWLEFGPLTAADATATLPVYWHQGEICPFNFFPDYMVQVTTPLASFRPGTYPLRVSVYLVSGDGIPPFMLQPLMMNFFIFVVPTNDPPTLTLTSGPNLNQVHLEVRGVPVVEYVLEVSNDLSNWIAIQTNKTGSFNRNFTTVPDSQQFFRTKIRPGSQILPSF